jgi:hypothetical protein
MRSALVCQLDVKGGLGKEISTCILMAAILLAVLLSFPSGFFAGAQTDTTLSNSTMVSSSIISSTANASPSTSNSSSTSYPSTTSSTQSRTSSTTVNLAVSVLTQINSNSTDSTITVPSISLNPGSGSAGLIVAVSGSDFSTNDTACSISGSVVASQTCSVSGGALSVSTAFTVDNVAGGSYNVKVTGTPSEDSASAQFTVNAPTPSITLTPSAQVGVTVQVSGSGFLTSDTACSLFGNPVTDSTCSVSNGTLTGMFTVANVAPSEYTIRARGRPGDDSVSTQLTVDVVTSMSSYSISFSPPYWLCTDVFVTFTGPLVESGFFGDTLQFQYFQYDPNLPSLLNPIFTDAPLTVTSDTVSYWIHYPEYAGVNFLYMPDIAVKVVDVTPKSNGYLPGLIFMELTNISPESYQSCQIDSSTPIPEFQVPWLTAIISLAVSSVFIQVRKRKIQSRC